MVADNRPGAGTALGADLVAKAPPDGYILLFNLSSHYAAAGLQKISYDPVADFVLVARLVSSGLFLVTATDSPFKSVADVVAAAKKKPGDVSFGSAGDGTTSHMGGALLNLVAGIDLVHVPYRDGSQAMVETANGLVEVAFSGPAALPMIKAGRLRVLATSGARRSSQMPDVPAIRETAGLEDYEIDSPVWAFAPKGTPAAIVDKLSEAFGQIAGTPAFKKFCNDQSLEPAYQPAAEAQAAAAAESAKWLRLVKLTRS